MGRDLKRGKWGGESGEGKGERGKVRIEGGRLEGDEERGRGSIRGKGKKGKAKR
jgi:hypothetical protein